MLVFGLGPLLVLVLRRPGVLFALLWCGAICAWWATRGAFRAEVAPGAFRRGLLHVLARFAVLAPLIALATFWLMPHDFLGLPRTRPRLWAAIMVLYPVLSVWPQEMLYRRFLFARYTPLFRSDGSRIAASALAFGYAHIIFLNPLAIAMTLAGGFLFARDYGRTRSLGLACVEHSLYGCLIFTVGLGRFFHTSSAWHHG